VRALCDYLDVYWQKGPETRRNDRVSAIAIDSSASNAAIFFLSVTTPVSEIIKASGSRKRLSYPKKYASPTLPLPPGWNFNCMVYGCSFTKTNKRIVLMLVSMKATIVSLKHTSNSLLQVPIDLLSVASAQELSIWCKHLTVRIQRRLA